MSKKGIIKIGDLVEEGAFDYLDDAIKKLKTIHELQVKIGYLKKIDNSIPIYGSIANGLFNIIESKIELLELSREDSKGVLKELVKILNSCTD